INLMTEQGNAFYSHSPRKTGILFRVDVDSLQNIGVDHSRSQNFKPAPAAVCLPPYIHFKTGFGKGEKTGAQAVDSPAPEHQLDKADKGFPEIGDTYICIYIQCFNLVKQEV